MRAVGYDMRNMVTRMVVRHQQAIGACEFVEGLLHDVLGVGGMPTISFRPPGADRVPGSRLRNGRRLVLVQGRGSDIGSLAHQKTLRCPLLAGQAPRKQDT